MEKLEKLVKRLQAEVRRLGGGVKAKKRVARAAGVSLATLYNVLKGMEPSERVLVRLEAWAKRTRERRKN